MKKMRQILALVLALVMVLSCFAGCTQNQEEKPEETKSQQQGGSKETTPAESEKTFSHPVTTEPITISILTTRHSTATNDAKDTWFFQHLEKWLHDEHGYNVKLDVQQTLETKEQISLLLGTDSLPDLIWGIALDNTQAVVFGEGEKMILDWTPYLNETYMPNAYARIYDPQNADALSASTAPDGGIYGLPQLGSRVYNDASSSIGANQDRMFFNTTWLAENNLKMPTNMEEFYAVLEAYKGKTVEGGEAAIPIMGQGGLLEKAFWTMLGYYGGTLSKYGTAFAIKNGQVELPVYTEDYKTFVEVMHKLYSEGYLSPDHFTMDKSTVRGLTQAGFTGVFSDNTLGFVPDFIEWESMPWFPINEGDEIIISTGSTYRVANTWASAATEYPEVLALIVDYLYTVEGAIAYNYGPKQGEDPLGIVDGWYLDETGKMTGKLVEDGTYESYESYCYQYIFPYSYVAGDNSLLQSEEASAILGKSSPKSYQIMDTVTGKEFTALETDVYDHSNAQGHWFLTNSAASRPYITTVNLPSVYMSEEDALHATELKSVLKNHVDSETAKFITGQRPLSELDAFQEELKTMGIEEYIDMYREAYAPFMDKFF